ncbi:DUF881 domain-containing protein [Flexivirga oryzae]|uniref:Uncharacterized protein YlxW (UPF0749 family) n=1 Tax=Flexivirga oryzae TaxID=1794944 RepID=A0A839N6M6_9MICO|nr:DUF881 domain-containing protein [Flexivirga oryzae]MBB2891733.1 uncharacterized protein YlxW (UPF0749 family) [Flexivirga oryzae]
MTASGQRPTGAPGADHGRTDPAWSMSLINNLMQAPLDPGYRAAADRRRAEGKPAAVGLRSPLLIVTLVVIGLCLAVAAHALRVPQAASDKRRTELIDGIKARQSTIDADSRTINSTRKQINALQAKALQHQNDTSLADRLRTLEVTTGAGAARGPGLVLTVDDAPGSGTDAEGNPRTDTSNTGRLTSTDLQIIVNGLWAAGAEAVSINGQRIASQTAIRFAGEAILVNFRALSPPYAISVIGGPKLADRFRGDAGGAYLRALVSGYDIRENLASKTSVAVPAAATAPLVHASAVTSPPSSSSTTQGGS